MESEIQKYDRANYRVTWSDAIRFPVSDFLKIYFAQSGYKDGLHGLTLALLQSFYSFIIFAKLWERAGFFQVDVPLKEVTKEFDRSRRDASYWVATTQMTEATNPLEKMWYKLVRRVGRLV